MPAKALVYLFKMRQPSQSDGLTTCLRQICYGFLCLICLAQVAKDEMPSLQRVTRASEAAVFYSPAEAVRKLLFCTHKVLEF